MIEQSSAVQQHWYINM